MVEKYRNIFGLKETEYNPQGMLHDVRINLLRFSASIFKMFKHFKIFIMILCCKSFSFLYSCKEKKLTNQKLYSLQNNISCCVFAECPKSVSENNTTIYIRVNKLSSAWNNIFFFSNSHNSFSMQWSHYLFFLNVKIFCPIRSISNGNFFWNILIVSKTWNTILLQLHLKYQICCCCFWYSAKICIEKFLHLQYIQSIKKLWYFKAALKRI